MLKKQAQFYKSQYESLLPSGNLNQNFSSNSNLNFNNKRLNDRWTTDGSLKCPHCFEEKIFQTQQSLENHIINFHFNKTQNSAIQEKRLPESVHEGENKCNECGKTFCNKYVLGRHIADKHPNFQQQQNLKQKISSILGTQNKPNQGKN